MKRRKLKQAAVKAGRQPAVKKAADKPIESTETVVVMASATYTSTAELQCDLGLKLTSHHLVLMKLKETMTKQSFTQGCHPVMFLPCILA